MLLQAAMFVLTSGRGLWRLRQWQSLLCVQKGPGRKEHSQGRSTGGEALRHSQEWEAGSSPREEHPIRSPAAVALGRRAPSLEREMKPRAEGWGQSHGRGKGTPPACLFPGPWICSLVSHWPDTTGYTVDHSIYVECLE